MDRKHGADLVSASSFQNRADVARRNVQSFGVDISKNRTRAGADDSAGRGEETEGGRDDGVAGLNASGQQSEPKSVCAGGATDGVGGVSEGRDLAFERFDFLP